MTVITLFQYRKGEGERGRERERDRERERVREREREMRMRGSLGEVLTEGRNFVVAGHRPLTRTPTQRKTTYLDQFRPLHTLGRVNTGRT